MPQSPLWVHQNCGTAHQDLRAPLNKDVVRRILAAYCRPDRSDGPSWLSFIGHTKDSLWSLDFFRCESIRLKTHWVLVVMDQATRQIIGFGIHSAVAVDGETLCRLFFQIIKQCTLL